MNFEVSVVDVDEVTKQLSFTVPQERVVKEYQSSLVSYSKSARVNGFRPGKVPKQMVERLMGDRIKYDVAHRLIDQALTDAFQEQELHVVGEPEVDLKDIHPDRALEFTVKVALFPQPTVSNYLNRQIKVVKRSVTDKDVETAIEQLRESKATLKRIEDRRTVAAGDVVGLTVATKIDGGEFSRPEPFVDQLGSGKLPADVEAQIVGMSVDESKEIATVGSENNPNPEMRSKNLVYKVSVIGLYDKIVPELNDELAKTLQLDVETVDGLKVKVKEELQKRAEADMRDEAEGALFELLVKENQFKVPQALIDIEIREMVARFARMRSDLDVSKIDVAPFREQLGESAANRIRTGILIDQIGSAEGIEINAEDRDKMIKRMAEQYGASLETVKRELFDRERIQSFLLEVRRTKVLEYLMAKTVIDYTDIDDAGAPQES